MRELEILVGIFWNLVSVICDCYCGYRAGAYELGLAGRAFEEPLLAFSRNHLWSLWPIYPR